jgi:hypothetical protein
MPQYQAPPPPPQSLQPGGVFYSFGSLTQPAGTETLETITTVAPSEPQPGAQCAITPGRAAVAPGPPSITVMVKFDAAPTSFAVNLEGAFIDENSEYQGICTLSGSNQITAQTFTAVVFPFLRLNLISITAGNATAIAGKIYR